MSATGNSLVAATLRELDRDRYFATLVVPEICRAAVQSLWAFNAEIAAIAGRVSEPAPGEIRLQWWVDLIEGHGHGDVLQNPIAQALMETVERFGLEKGPVLRLLAARRFDLYQDPMPDIETFEGYAGETLSVLFQYSAAILNNGEMLENGDAAGHLGVALSLWGHIRAFGYNASRGRIFLPLSVFTAHDVTEKEILAGKTSSALAQALAQIAEIAAGHVQQAKSAISTMPKSLRPAFAQIALAKSLETAAYRAVRFPFEIPQTGSGWRKLGALMLWSWRQNR